MDLTSYADLAIELVNTQDPDHGDALRDLAGLHGLLARRPHLSGRIGHRDLDTVRGLRAQLREVFAAVGAGDEEAAIERLNALLIQHPIHPQLARHDALGWHVHLNEGGSVPDRIAARAAMGLAVRVEAYGIDRLGMCRADGCERVFFDSTANRSRRFCSDRCARRPRVSEPASSRPLTRDGNGRYGGEGRPAGKTAARDGGQ